MSNSDFETPAVRSRTLATDAPIVLQVAARRFVTMEDTLKESGFFKVLLSGRWTNRLEDGSYFIDADPTIFGHILNYLRRGVFPLCFDKDKGHDQTRYHEVFVEARYFRISALEEWLTQKRYLDAVRVVRHIETFSSNSEVTAFCNDLPSDTAVEKIEVTTGVSKVYLCPANESHRGNPNKCDNSCANVERWKCDVKWNPCELWVDEVYQRFMVTTVKTVFNHDGCI